jgi:lipopolysaccharide/colanic/teichoic acid biosynthesis glycosyltransferase
MVQQEGTGITGGLPRWVDAFLALFGLLCVSPLLGLSALAVRFSSPGPVLFRQERVGRGRRQFLLLKFRTMFLDNTGPKVTRKGDARVTGVGRLLRKTKLDELPELWNVLVGDLALVGPRPEVPRYVDASDPRWEEILRVRPGITDPVTLKLRNEEELMGQVEGDQEAFYTGVLQPCKLDGYLRYLNRRSARSDIRVLTETVLAIFIPSRTPPPSLDEVRENRIPW